MEKKRNKGMTYKKAGVDIERAKKGIDLSRANIELTYTDEVLAGLGLFAGAVDLKKILSEYRQPVMVTSTDGAGTITWVAEKANEIFPAGWFRIGYSVAVHCFADIATLGAKPKVFFNSISAEKINPKINREILSGMSQACQEADCILGGGETAEMPGIICKDQYDVSGTVVGFVEKDKIIIAPQLIQPGDIIIGIESWGIHLNGLSLARASLFKGIWGRLSIPHRLQTKIPAGKILAQELLWGMPNYSPIILSLLDKKWSIHGLAHITGGGLKDNVERLLPESCQAKIYKSALSSMPIFSFIQKKGKVADEEMFKTFNLGVGFVIITLPEFSNKIKSFIKNNGFKAFLIGEIVPGEKGGVDFIR